ncbi:MAG TPA: hypothetical protein VE868_10295 [Balneolaceae bacterium]|nr:hypothetical protein [Balneolaceae bacterium]
MNKNQKIEQQVEKTLHALDDAERAKTDEYFFSRLEKRMQEKNAGEPTSQRISLSIAAVMLLILVNIITLLHYNHASQTSQNSMQTQEIQMNALAEKYFFTEPVIYKQSETIPSNGRR